MGKSTISMAIFNSYAWFTRGYAKNPGTLKFFPFKSLSFAIVEQVAAVWTFSRALLGLGSLAGSKSLGSPS